jgi:hypothetical protein
MLPCQALQAAVGFALETLERGLGGPTALIHAFLKCVRKSSHSCRRVKERAILLWWTKR